MTVFHIDVPTNFSFRHTAQSHGWYDLMPFEFDAERSTLRYVFAGDPDPVTIEIGGMDGKLSLAADSAIVDKDAIGAAVRHIFRLDDDIAGFYALTADKDGLRWVCRSNAGRLLRSPTVWEDLVKTICTTNCSWGLTKKMVENLVVKLGVSATDGRHAFPTADAMAAQTEEFYRDEIRAGYRSPYFVELAGSVAAGRLDPEAWLNSELPTGELKKEMKTVKGVGDYAAENLLKLVGRYDGLALDSWLRSQFYKRHNNERPCPDKKIERHYMKYGPWRGLAIWFDMTERWFDER